MATRQPVAQEIALLSQKLDQVIDVVNETRQDVKAQTSHNESVDRLLAKHDIQIEHVEEEVKNWKTINSVGVLISSAMAALATWLTTK